MILADYGTLNAQVFIGSENFSQTSLDRNRELGILVTEPEILERLHTTFEADWTK
jgi:phosphatidylserine/phosphatidylglycerophosphate/cardiolipin synthase-like enzyme